MHKPLPFMLLCGLSWRGTRRALPDLAHHRTWMHLLVEELPTPTWADTQMPLRISNRRWLWKRPTGLCAGRRPVRVTAISTPFKPRFLFVGYPTNASVASRDRGTRLPGSQNVLAANRLVRVCHARQPPQQTVRPGHNRPSYKMSSVAGAPLQNGLHLQGKTGGTSPSPIVKKQFNSTFANPCSEPECTVFCCQQAGGQ